MTIETSDNRKPDVLRNISFYPHFVQVFFEADGEALKGQLVKVHIDRVQAYTLYGRMVGSAEPQQPAAVAAQQPLVPMGMPQLVGV